MGGENQSQSAHCLTSLFALKFSSLGWRGREGVTEKNSGPLGRKVPLTCAGVGVAGAGVLDAAGVEAAGGWVLLMDVGCVDGVGAEVVLAALGARGRGVAFTVRASVRSNLFSWLVALLDTREIENIMSAAIVTRDDATGKLPYPGAEGPSGCEGVLARGGAEAVTASSVT